MPSTRSKTPAMSYQDILDSDRNPPPDSYRWPSDPCDGPTRVPVERYISRAAHEREKEFLWSRVWQIACRVEHLRAIGDTVVYDIADKSYVLVRVGPGDDDINAYPNACLHRGRALRDGPGRVTELQCPFHGFCWSLDGKLKRIPSAWDFAELVPNSLTLPRVAVGHWGGFVFINPDPDCEPLADYLGVLPEMFSRWPLDRRYTKTHVTKVINANWKLVQEAFMESYHVITTHPQLLPGFGDANSQYDLYGNIARAISPRGVPSPLLAWQPTEQQQLDSALDVRDDDPALFALADHATARHTLATAAADFLRPVLGQDVDELSDAELVDSYFVNIFPNSHPWGAYNQIHYRFRPNGDDHRSCLMEVLLLAPFTGPAPPPAPEIRLGPDDAWRDAVDELGSLARVFDQDEYNLEAVQRGLLATTQPTILLADYQERKIRHFHQLYEKWIPASG